MTASPTVRSVQHLDVLRRAGSFVRERLDGETTGHDWLHSRRVAATAGRIAEREGADVLVCTLAGLLHDVADGKVDDGSGRAALEQWLDEHVDDLLAARVRTVLEEVAYRHPAPDDPLSLEAQCVFDADKLEWIGALGIARTFAYGGSIGRMIRSDDGSVETTYTHCRARLGSVASQMRTATGRRFARPRQRVVDDFLDQFDAEWSTDHVDTAE